MGTFISPTVGFPLITQNNLKKNNVKINQTVTKIKHVLGIFPLLKYIYKSACVTQAALLYLL